MSSDVRPLLTSPNRRAERRPEYARVGAELEALILERDLEDTTPLPSEGALAARFGVSRGTLRRAVELLASEGLLRREPGRGTFVEPVARLRHVVWSRLAEVAEPDSRFGRDFTRFVPDFSGSDRCADRVAALPEYAGAGLVFVTPDNNLEVFRARALNDGKDLLVATMHLREGFVRVHAARVPAGKHDLAATLDGLRRFAEPVPFAELHGAERIPLVVTGAVAATPDGDLFGSGQGFFDLEWSLLAGAQRVDADTVVVASVHDCQVVDVDIPRVSTDCPADVVVTPTRWWRAARPRRKPRGSDAAADAAWPRGVLRDVVGEPSP